MNSAIEKILNENIERIDISCNSINTLKDNKIISLKQLCSKNRKELKNLGLETNDIKKAETELQLLGLNLRTDY